MKALVLGLGRMGQATGYALRKLGMNVTGYDISPDIASQAINHVNKDDWCADQVYWTKDFGENFDIVISCLPYNENYNWAHWAITNGLRYCDLGGSIPMEDRIIKFATRQAKKPIFPSLGLAPGLVNIIAEEEFSKFPVVPTDVHLYCGGMPIVCGPPMYYGCNWNISGLLNEYFDKAEVLVNGKIEKWNGLSYFSELPELFHIDRNAYRENVYYQTCITSGGLSNTARLMQTRGVKNCSYSTLRVPGHYAMLLWLQKTMGYNEGQLKDFLSKACQFDGCDKVILAIRINKENLIQTFDFCWYQEEKDKFTAMQTLTGFTIASVANLMARGDFDDFKVCNYSQIKFCDFDNNMKKLGIDLYGTSDEN